MSVVIIGGHDRMVRQYKEICENHKYKAKVFTQMKTLLISRVREIQNGRTDRPQSSAADTPTESLTRLTWF